MEMSSFHSYSCLNRQSLYFFAVALIHSSLSAAVLMKRQSGFNIETGLEKTKNSLS